MKLPIISKDKIKNPLNGFGYAFIDEEDKKLKVKKIDGIIEFTNTLDDTQLLNLTDYTAFNVWPTYSDIISGTVLSNIVFHDGRDDVPYLNGLTVHTTISAYNTERFKIRSYNDISDIDVIVDWGDENFTKLSDLTPSVSDDPIPEYTYELIHEYVKPDKNENQIYTVKVFGEKYFAIQHLYSDMNGLLCECFGKNLPIASHINNFAGFAGRCLRLFKVELSEYIQNKQIYSLANTFLYCQNLEYARGFDKLPNNLYQTQQCFGTCSAMTFCDLRLPGYVTSVANTSKNPYKATFAYCSNLEVDVLSLLPANGYLMDEVVFGAIFNSCPKLTCSDYDKLANMLWNNKHVKFVDSKISSTGTLAAFRQCSAELRSHVPASWGGTASDDIIEKSWEEKYNDLLARVEALESK